MLPKELPIDSNDTGRAASTATLAIWRCTSLTIAATAWRPIPSAYPPGIKLSAVPCNSPNAHDQSSDAPLANAKVSMHPLEEQGLYTSGLLVPARSRNDDPTAVGNVDNVRARPALAS